MAALDLSWVGCLVYSWRDLGCCANSTGERKQTIGVILESWNQLNILFTPKLDSHNHQKNQIVPSKLRGIATQGHGGWKPCGINQSATRRGICPARRPACPSPRRKGSRGKEMTPYFVAEKSHRGVSVSL